MTQRNFAELPNGLLIDLDEVTFVAQGGVNEYHVFFKRPGPVAPKLDRRNFEALRLALGATKYDAPEEPAAEKPALIAAVK